MRRRSGSTRPIVVTTGFSGTGSVELLRSLGAQLGDAALNPAVTPIVVIDRGGKVVLAPAGHKDVATLVALVGA